MATTSGKSLWSSLLISDHVSFHVHVPFGLTSAENWVHCLPLALLAEGGAVHPDLNPFFYFLAIVFKYRILPVPWPVRLLALWDQLSIWKRRVSIKCHNSECFQRISKASLTSALLATWTSSWCASMLLPMPVLLSTKSGERMSLVAPLSLSLGSLGLFTKKK